MLYFIVNDIRLFFWPVLVEFGRMQTKVRQSQLHTITQSTTNQVNQRRMQEDVYVALYYRSHPCLVDGRLVGSI